MKYILILLILLAGLTVRAQIPEFSKLSGNITSYSELVRGTECFFLYNNYFDPTYQTKIYRITEQGEVTDSMNLRDLNRYHNGKIAVIEGKLYFGGASTDTTSNNSQRYNIIEFDDDLNIIWEYRSEILDTLISPLYNTQTTDGTNSILFNFTVFKDTIYVIGGYLQFDTMITPLGGDCRYFKANFNGDTYQNRSFNGSMYNAFFRGNQMYFQGSNFDPNAPWLPPAVGLYNGDGQFVDGSNFDNSTSGEFPWGACGGIIDDKLYFSYLGRDPSLPGCPQQTVAIDVRDTAFNIIHRFKVNECEYNYAGDMPFTKGTDGSIYFQAAHQDYKKFMVKKYSPEMNLIWSREYEFSTNPYFIIPMKLVPTEDGGVIAHCRQQLNGQFLVRLYKISPDGDIVSSTTLGGDGKPEPSVLSPNPCQDIIRYTGENTHEMTAEVYSIDGRIAKRIFFINNQLDLSGLPKGLYSILIFDNQQQRLLHRQTVVKME